MMELEYIVYTVIYSTTQNTHTNTVAGATERLYERSEQVMYALKKQKKHSDSFVQVLQVNLYARTELSLPAKTSVLKT